MKSRNGKGKKKEIKENELRRDGQRDGETDR